MLATERPFIISERAIFRPVNGEKSGLTSIDKIDKTKDFVGSGGLVAAFLLAGTQQAISIGLHIRTSIRHEIFFIEFLDELGNFKKKNIFF